jgi:SAM-dependent methyltransferase
MKNSDLCRVSGKPLENVFDLGIQPLGNGFLDKDQFSAEYYFPLSVGFCETSCMLQLIEQPNPKKMFHEEYAFYSSTSKVMEQHFKDFAEQIMSHDFPQQQMFVVELGCNDGIMLKHFAGKGIRHLGIEPSRNVAEIANQHGVVTISEFFSEKLAEKIASTEGKVDVFCAANVMCHIPDVLEVAKGIRHLLKPKGLLIFEDPYLGDVVENTAYDQIYDEHVFIFSAHSVRYLFAQEGLELINVEKQSTHGGSLRYTLAHKGAYPVRPVVPETLEKERRQGLDKIETFLTFGRDIAESKKEFTQLLKNLRSEGKRIAGYAASSKSTTVLNYCEIGPELIEHIFDSTPSKQGKYSPGQHIPIVHQKLFRDDPPDFAIIFAWNHMKEIIEKEQQFREAGGQWIVHLPRARILE